MNSIVTQKEPAMVAVEQRAFMMTIEAATQGHVMPPDKYVWLHHQARLSASDLGSLKAWARAEPRPTPKTEAATATARADSRHGRRPGEMP